MILRGLLLIDPGKPPTPGWVEVEAGSIVRVEEGEPARRVGEPMLGGPRRIVCPGFIDAHVHLPQADSIGCAGMGLIDWLDRVIYPAESWWGRAGAHRTLDVGVARMLRQGTLGFAGYLSSHADAGGEAVRRLASGAGLPARLRAAVGRVAMDRNAPDDLTAEDRRRAAMSPAPSLALAEPQEGGGRVEVSINPRFAIACSEELLAEAGWLARERLSSGRPIVVQTHLAESAEEVEVVRRLFPDDAHYTGVYDRFGLLTERTLLAHCVHLSPEEWELIRARRSVAVHCPGANLFLESGLFDLASTREHGVRLALGSDVAAGPDFAMPRVARSMIETAQARRLTMGSAVVPTPAEAWRMITSGNAEALGWADAGRFEPGASADLLVLRTPETWLDEHLVGRLLYGWSAALIEERIVAGVRVPHDALGAHC